MGAVAVATLSSRQDIARDIAAPIIENDTAGDVRNLFDRWLICGVGSLFIECRRAGNAVSIILAQNDMPKVLPRATVEAILQFLPRDGVS